MTNERFDQSLGDGGSDRSVAAPDFLSEVGRSRYVEMQDDLLVEFTSARNRRQMRRRGAVMVGGVMLILLAVAVPYSNSRINQGPIATKDTASSSDRAGAVNSTSGRETHSPISPCIVRIHSSSAPNVARFSTRSPAIVRAESTQRISDDELTGTLREIGYPVGIIRMGGEVKLSGDASAIKSPSDRPDDSSSKVDQPRILRRGLDHRLASGGDSEVGHSG